MVWYLLYGCQILLHTSFSSPTSRCSDCVYILAIVNRTEEAWTQRYLACWRHWLWLLWWLALVINLAWSKIGSTEMKRPILDCMKRRQSWREHSSALLPNCRRSVTSCLRRLLPKLPTMMDHTQPKSSLSSLHCFCWLFCLSDISNNTDNSPEVELMNHIIVLFFNFWKASILSITTVLTLSSIAYESFHFCISPNLSPYIYIYIYQLIILAVFDNTHLKSYWVHISAFHLVIVLFCFRATVLLLLSLWTFHFFLVLFFSVI